MVGENCRQERFRWIGTPNVRTDVWALGAVCYELFTGHPPFEGGPASLVRAVMTDEPTPPSAVADVPPGLDDVLLTALATERADRYESVRYLREDRQKLFDAV